MKLPGFGYGGVQSLGRHDVYQPLQVAATKGAVAQTIAASGARVLELYQARRDELDSRRINSSFVQLKMDWLKQNAGKKEYSPDEIPEDLEVLRVIENVDAKGNLIETPRERIPAFEVYPRLYEKMLNSLIEAHEKQFANQDLGSRWATKQRESAYASVAKASLDAIDQQRQYGIQQTLQQANQAVEDRAYDLARELVMANGDIEEPVQRENLLRIDKKEESDRYDQLIYSLHKEGLEAALVYITDHENYDGALNDSEVKSYASQIRTALNQLAVGESRALTEYHNHLKRRTRSAITLLEEGRLLNSVELSSLLDEMVDIDHGLAEDLSMAIQYADMFRALAIRPTVEARRALHASMINAQQNYPTTIESVKLVAMLDRAMDRIEANIDHDPLKFYQSLQVNNRGELKELPPVDYNNLAESLQQRLGWGEAIHQMWRIPRVYMTEQEATELSEYIRNSDVSGKVTLARAIHEGLGEHAYRLYDQIQMKEVGAFVEAGRSYAEGDINAARVILEGEHLMRANPTMLTDISQELDLEANQILETIVGFDPDRLAQTRNAIRGVYLTLTQGTDRGHVKKAILETATRMVTGGLVEVGNARVTTPVRNMDGRTFTRWLDNITPAYIDQLGGTHMYSSEQVISGLRHNRIQLLEHGDRGSYALLDLLSSRLIFKAGGKEPFVLVYDVQAPIEKPNIPSLPGFLMERHTGANTDIIPPQMVTP